MKITHLHIENFIGARAVALDTTAPVQIFAGRNGAGKSSIRDAVVLALTGDLGRVTLKKDAAQLISDGATGPAVCIVTTDDDAAHSVSISPAGKLNSSRKHDPDPALSYVLDAQLGSSPRSWGTPYP